jgi:hypothetical protein
MNYFSKIALASAIIGGGLFVSCSDDDDTPYIPTPTPTASIYDRLGGTTLVADPNNDGQMIEQGRLSYRSVVDSTITLILTDIGTGADGNLGAHFAPILAETGATQTTNVARLSDNLTDFFSFNTGGTNAVNTYTGLDMVSAHNPATNPRMGTKANDANYTKFEGYVGAAANLNGVASNTQLYADVVAVLETLRQPIVQDPN